MKHFSRVVSLLLIFTLTELSVFCDSFPVTPQSVPPLMYGCAWYPEQWPESDWEADLTKMQAAGLNMVRIGEFAWSSLEPNENHYELDWMERAITAASKHGMVTIIGTPTDTPPAWMTTKYPEILRVTEDGTRLEHGSRRHFSIGSEKYRALCKKIVGKLAVRFGKNPNVVAWQIGNEYTEDSFDLESRARFHRWLERKYGSLEELNKNWGTAYWSQTYTKWNEIPMTTGRANPGLLLEYKRFVTDTWRDFQRDQIEVLRKQADPRQITTTNLGGLGWANRFNRQLIAADLDIISWDEYLGAGWFDKTKNGTGHLDPTRSGASHDLVRGWKQKNFWVMEMAPGYVDWGSVSNALDPGETRAMAWHAVGHGADGIGFWQWRSALNGQEQYHGSIVGPDGEPLPIYEEIAKTGAEFAIAGPVLNGTQPVSEVALLHDYDSRWAIEFNPFSQRYDQMQILIEYYRALSEATQSIDIITPEMDLKRYKLIIAPSLNVISTALAEKLTEYVLSGGHLVLGPRSGMKNEFNALNRWRQPGPLAITLGGRVEQYYALIEDLSVNGPWGSGKATIWAERLQPLGSDTEVMLRYGSGKSWLSEMPAAIRRRHGEGSITYLGAVLDDDLMGRIVFGWVKEAGISSPFIQVPQGIKVCRRTGNGNDLFIILNFSHCTEKITLPSSMVNVLTGSEVMSITLPRYDVVILKRSIKIN